ncbi:MAG: hypothetical protein Q8Q99_13005 [Polaromonas sp.]|nr:hypothetical protein [Polaromonas sp.]
MLKFIEQFGIRLSARPKRTCVGAVQSCDACLTVMVQVVGQFFEIKSVRTHVRQQKDEHQ